MITTLRSHKKIIPLCIIFCLVLFSVWLFFAPLMEKQQAEDHQQQLLASIEQGSGVIEIDEQYRTIHVDFYDDDRNSPEVERLDTTIVPTALSADTISDSSPVPMPTPISDSDEITGIGILTIDRINLKLPVTDGVSEAQLKVAVGHIPETASAGSAGNAVIAGHRSLTYGEFFNRLDELVVGDVIGYEDIGGQEYEFEVYEVIELLPDDQSAFEQYKDKAVLTLYTCTPIRKATHGLVIRTVRTV